MDIENATRDSINTELFIYPNTIASAVSITYDSTIYDSTRPGNTRDKKLLKIEKTLETCTRLSIAESFECRASFLKMTYTYLSITLEFENYFVLIRNEFQLF